MTVWMGGYVVIESADMPADRVGLISVVNGKPSGAVLRLGPQRLPPVSDRETEREPENDAESTEHESSPPKKLSFLEDDHGT